MESRNGKNYASIADEGGVSRAGQKNYSDEAEKFLLRFRIFQNVFILTNVGHQITIFLSFERSLQFLINTKPKDVVKRTITWSLQNMSFKLH